MTRGSWIYLVVFLAIVVVLLMACGSPLGFGQIRWQYNPAHYPQVVQWAGCHAAVAVDAESSPVESFYVPSAHTMVVGTKMDDSVPYYVGVFILLHETGHCLQDESGWLSKQYDIVTVELDADRRASDLACGMGLDGRQISHDTFTWVHDTFGYDGDWNHGSLAQRMAQANAAHACDAKATEHA